MNFTLTPRKRVNGTRPYACMSIEILASEASAASGPRVHGGAWLGASGRSGGLARLRFLPEDRIRAWLGASIAGTRRFERQKSTDKGAREGPRHDFRRFRVDFGIDFRCFPRQHCASDVTRSASGRTLDFADRRGTLEGSQTLRKARKSTQIDGKSLRRRFANEPRGKKLIFALPGATWRRF